MSLLTENWGRGGGGGKKGGGSKQQYGVFLLLSRSESKRTNEFARTVKNGFEIYLDTSEKKTTESQGERERSPKGRNKKKGEEYHAIKHGTLEEKGNQKCCPLSWLRKRRRGGTYQHKKSPEKKKERERSIVVL